MCLEYVKISSMPLIPQYFNTHLELAQHGSVSRWECRRSCVGHEMLTNKYLDEKVTVDDIFEKKAYVFETMPII